jgi:CRP/FNR family transcriptional regulator
VSRALSKMARDRIIAFAAKGRREIRITDLAALSAYFERCLAPTPIMQ